MNALFEVTYARKAAIGNTIRCFGLSCSDGAALVTAARDADVDPEGDSRRVSKYQDTRILRDPTKHLFKVDTSISVALTGIPSDCRHILKILRKEAQDYRSNFGEPIPASIISDKVAAHLHDLTMSPDTRPMAVTVLIGARFVE